MQYKVILKPEAEKDLDEAIIWYEKQREGLGIDLLLHFEDALKLIQSNPFLYAKVLFHFRKTLMDKFPYAIYYAVNEQNNIVDVYAVLITSRSPKIFKKRIKIK
jgi:plasmid stabilization system protein ParE